jgi:hypothetical protein
MKGVIVCRWKHKFFDSIRNEELAVKEHEQSAEQARMKAKARCPVWEEEVEKMVISLLRNTTLRRDYRRAFGEVGLLGDNLVMT